MPVPIGVSVWSGLGAGTVPYLDRVVGAYESIWFPDHLQSNRGDVMEGWTLFTYCLARYPDVLAGHQVLCNEFRDPGLLAKMVASAQVLSGGRVVVGLGAGWHRDEAEAFGIPFPSTGERFARLGESIRLMRALWSGNEVDFDGEWYRVAGARCTPAPEPVPPVMIGGSGPRHALAAVARSADWWNHIYRGPDGFAAASATLARHCEAIGRDPAGITPVLGTQVLIGETASEVRRMQQSDDVRSVEQNGIAGTPDQIADLLAAGIEAGARRIIVGFADSPRTDGSELFAETVLTSLASP